MLEAGCRIFLHPGMLHGKFMLVDEAVATVGSANMDIRSFHLNYEVTAMFYDAGVNAALGALFAREQRAATALSHAEREQLGTLRVAAESLGRVLGPLL